MKKGRIMRLVAFIMTLCLIWTTCLPGVRAKSVTYDGTKYDGDYNISTILSRFQYFVSGDSTLQGHTNGAIVVGGGLSLNQTLGDGAIAPSYINDIKEKVNIQSTPKISASQWCTDIYYRTGAENIDGGPFSGDWSAGNWIQLGEKDEYISLSEAFSSIQSESKKLKDGADSSFLTVDASSVTIDCTGDKDVYVTIDYSTIENKTIYIQVNEKTLGNYNYDVDWFKNHVCCISITGVGSKMANLNFEGMIKLKHNQEADGNMLSGKLKNMSGTDDDQVNLGGMNLVWNFPDATGTITATALSGHLVAPSAKVDVGGSNYEGGVIAREITGKAEGHFYPMKKGILKTTGTTDPTDPEKPGTDPTDPEKPGTDPTDPEKPGTGTTTPGGNTGTTDPGTTNPGGGTGTTDPGTTTPGASTDTPSTATGDLEIVVQDEKTGDPVPNAKVEIVYPNGRRDTATTDENGKITKKGLEPGDYTITVTEVPDGYTVTTGKQEKATVVAGGTTQHVVKINSEGAANAEKEDEDDEDDTDDGGEAEAASKNAAKTGDAFPIAVPVVLLIGAATTMFILGYKKRYE